MKLPLYRCLTAGIALLGIACASPSWATGVECNPPGGPIEKAICTDPALLKMDNALGALYDDAVLKDPQVNQRQMNWVQNRLSKCDSKECLVTAYQDQIVALGGDWERVRADILASAPPVQLQQQPAAPKAQEPTREELARRAADEHTRQARLANEQMNKQAEGKRNLYILLAAIAAVIGGFIWNRFIRNRCPHCKSTKYQRVGMEEIDRWRGTKQVTERTAHGKTKTRHVQATYVLMHFAYQCQACQGEWEKERQEEIGKGSNLGRFLTGH